MQLDGGCTNQIDAGQVEVSPSYAVLNQRTTARLKVLATGSGVANTDWNTSMAQTGKKFQNESQMRTASAGAL